MKKETKKTLRYFLKDDIRLKTDFSRTDQNLGVPAPPIEKPCADNAQLFDLPSPEDVQELGQMTLQQAIVHRHSRRKFGKTPLSLKELSFLLWATQGVRKKKYDIALRTVPSAGNRHALETYLAVQKVSGLEPGVYRYLPSRHQLVLESTPEDLDEKLTDAALQQPFAGNSAVTFIWTTIPYRMEWRYEEASYKVIALDAGHACQNLYLACESIHAGTCAIAAYHQQLADELLGVDGEEEFVVYMAPIGKQ